MLHARLHFLDSIEALNALTEELFHADQGPFYVLWTRVTHPLDRFLKTTDFQDTAFVSDNSQCCIGSDQHTEGLGSGEFCGVFDQQAH